MRWENIDLKNGWVQLRAEETKARRDDVLPLAPDLAKALKKAARPAGLVFASSPTLKTLQRDLKRAKIEYETERGQVDRKSLRKTFGTHLARAGVELQTAVKLMRHSDPKLTLNIYTDPMLLDMKAAVERIGGQGKNRR